MVFQVKMEACCSKHSEKMSVILSDSDVPGAKLVKHSQECVIEELKRWLEYHGLKKTGKKDELVSRVREALCLNLPVDPKIDGGKWYNLKAGSSRQTQT